MHARDTTHTFSGNGGKKKISGIVLFILFATKVLFCSACLYPPPRLSLPLQPIRFNARAYLYYYYFSTSTSTTSFEASVPVSIVFFLAGELRFRAVHIYNIYPTDHLPPFIYSLMYIPLFYSLSYIFMFIFPILSIFTVCLWLSLCSTGHWHCMHTGDPGLVHLISRGWFYRGYAIYAIRQITAASACCFVC